MTSSSPRRRRRGHPRRSPTTTRSSSPYGWRGPRLRTPGRTTSARPSASWPPSASRCQSVSLKDVQDYIAGLDAMAPSTKALAVSAVKSLLTFGHEIGYLAFNVGRVVKAPPVKNDAGRAHPVRSRHTPDGAARAEHPEPGDAHSSIWSGPADLRSRRARCRDLTPRDEAGQITVYGKGGKTRVVLLSAASWKLLKDCGIGELDEPGVHVPAGWGARRQPDPSRREGCCCPGGAFGRGVRPLAPSRPRQPFPRSGRGHPSGAGDAGPCLRLDHGQVSPRAAVGQLGALSSRCEPRRRACGGFAGGISLPFASAIQPKHPITD